MSHCSTITNAAPTYQYSALTQTINLSPNHQFITKPAIYHQTPLPQCSTIPTSLRHICNFSLSVCLLCPVRCFEFITKPSIYHQTSNLSPNPPSHNAVQFPPPYVTFATSHCLSVCSVRSAVLNRVKTVVFTFLEGKMRIWGWNSKQWLLPYWPLTLTNRKQNYTKNIILYTGCIFFCACEDSQFHGIGRMENLHSSEIYRTSECLLTGHCEWRQNIYI